MQNIMLELLASSNAEQKFTSLYLVEQINLFRDLEGNRAVLPHSDFLKKLRVEFEEEIAEGNISYRLITKQLAHNSTQIKSYELTYRQALNMLMSESRTVREHVMDVLEAQQKEIAKLKAADMPKTFSEALRMLADSEDAKLLAEHNSEELKIELDKSKEWFSIKKIAHRNNLNWKKLDWRLLKKASDVCGYLPKKIFDANFPNGVNAYHYQSWKIVYPDLRYALD
jgi:lysyl-tRNA synthetase class I